MDPAKQKRLEAAGWKVGTVAEFLGLTEAESLIIETEIYLRDAFIKRRAKLGLSQTEVAKRMGSAQARVAKLEAGKPDISAEFMIRGLFALGMTPADVGGIIARVKLPAAEARAHRNAKTKTSRVLAAAKTARAKKR